MNDAEAAVERIAIMEVEGCTPEEIAEVLAKYYYGDEND